MDYGKFFSLDTASFMSSPVREIFSRVKLDEIYSFAGGYPSEDTFPLDDIDDIMSKVICKYGGKAFQYGATQGVIELRKALAERYDVPIDNIQITSSSQQGIDVCTRILVDPGDVVLTFNPTYLGAIQSFKSYRAEIVGVSHKGALEDFENAFIDAIERVNAEGKKLKFLYVIPDFQNPSGETLTLKERVILIDLAKEYDFLIVEDCPYRELRYEGESLPTIYSMSQDRVIHLGSFSKIFAPGFRIGWMFAPKEILEKIYICKQSLDLCPPVFDQYVAAEFMGSGLLDENLKKSIRLYRGKRDTMLGLLEKYMPEKVSWTSPEGGLFLYLILPDTFDAVAFYEKALSAGVAYVAGNFFCPDGSGHNTMRLNFSFMDEEKIKAGIPLLCQLISEEI